MKIQHLIPILFLAGFCTVSAQTNDTPASASRMTEAQVLALAKPMLPLGANEGYSVYFRSNDWVVATLPIKNGRGYYRVMTIQDSDGKVLEVTNLPFRLSGAAVVSEGISAMNVTNQPKMLGVPGPAIIKSSQPTVAVATNTMLSSHGSE
jgi:hypothetical protein